jgi:hypothetical protein
MNDEFYELNNLTKTDLVTILESLLFSCSVDVNASWYKENIDVMLNLIKRIRITHPEILTENIYICETDINMLNDEHSEEIINIFPEIEKQIV